MMNPVYGWSEGILIGRKDGELLPIIRLGQKPCARCRLADMTMYQRANYRCPYCEAGIAWRVRQFFGRLKSWRIRRVLERRLHGALDT